MRFRLRLFVADEYKPLRLVPPLMWPLTIGALLAQIAFSVYLLPPPEVRQRDYENPPSLNLLRAASLGEPETLAKLLVLQIQAFDNQPGVSVPFIQLNYEKLGLWLDNIVALDERAEYPHFLMSKVYSQVKETSRQYESINWVWLQFLRRPNDRWWWMAHTTNFAKHIVEDDDIALKMARDLRTKTDAGKVPGWPRQMEAFFLENQSEFDSAAGILQNQLEAGEITDPQEFIFLIERIEGIIVEMNQRGEFQTEQAFNEKLQTVDALRDKFLEQFDDIEIEQ